MIMVIKPDGKEGVIKIPEKSWSEYEKLGYVQAEATEGTDEASGYQGETEPRELTFRARGDFRLDRPVDERYADSIQMELQAKGIKAEVEPDPTAYDGFRVHTLADPAAVEKALTELDFIESSALPYKDQLSEEKK